MISSNKNSIVHCGIVLLAAGASVRLGKPKQLMPFKETTILGNALQIATTAGFSQVVTVLGAHAAVLKEAKKNNKPVTVINEDWNKGMATSIQCGLIKILEIEPEIEAVIFMVCDQPFVSTKLLTEIIEKYQQTGKPIIASSYKNNFGTPALFHKSFFAALLKLTGDTGAKKIIYEHPALVSVVDFPMGYIDIDTEKDYDELLLRK